MTTPGQNGKGSAIKVLKSTIEPIVVAASVEQTKYFKEMFTEYQKRIESALDTIITRLNTIDKVLGYDSHRARYTSSNDNKMQHTLELIHDRLSMIEDTINNTDYKVPNNVRVREDKFSANTITQNYEDLGVYCD